MAVTLYNGGQIQGVRTQAQPLTGQVINNGKAAIGQAIAGVGQQAFSIYERMAKVRDTQELLDAENSMQQKALEFDKWRQENPDQDTWASKWEEMSGDLRDSWSEKKLTPEGASRLTAMFSHWSSAGMRSVQEQGFQQAERRAKQAVDNTISTALQNDDLPRAMAAVDLYASTSSQSPETIEGLRIDVQNQFHTKAKSDASSFANAFAETGNFDAALAEIQDAPFSDAEKAERIAKLEKQKMVFGLITQANDDPKSAIEQARKLETAGQITGPERVRVVGAAEQRIDTLRTDSLKSYTEEIKMGTPDARALINKINGNTYLQDSDRKALFQYLSVGPVNDPAAYADLWTKAKTFEGQEGSPEYSRLVTNIDMALDGEQKASVMSQLSATVKGPKDGQTRAFNEVYSMLNEDLKAGVFGASSAKLSDPSVVLPPNIRKEIDALKSDLLTARESEKIAADPKREEYIELKARNKWWNNLTSPDKGGSFTDYFVDDERMKRDATNRAFEITASLDKWRSENPKATPAEFKAKYEELTAVQRSAAGIKTGFVNPLLPSLAPAQKTDITDILKRHAANPGK